MGLLSTVLSMEFQCRARSEVDARSPSKTKPAQHAGVGRMDHSYVWIVLDGSGVPTVDGLSARVVGPGLHPTSSKLQL